MKQAAPGADWAMGSGHEIKLDYQTNTATEVKLYKAATTWNSGSGLYDISFSDGGNYGATPEQLLNFFMEDLERLLDIPTNRKVL